MKLQLQLFLAVCLASFITTQAAIKKASYQEVKKILTSEKSKVPTIYLMPPRQNLAIETSTPAVKMPYVDAANFRQSTTVAPVTTSTRKVPFYTLREEASLNLKIMPSVENDRVNRFTTSIVFGIGGSDGYGF